MSIEKIILVLILVCGAAAYFVYGRSDWRADDIAAAETAIRVELGDTAARFSRVQITGNSRTGQTCGFVETDGSTTRFIVYIDGTAGPFLDHGMGAHYVSPSRFDFAWQNDCVNEGYTS